MSIVRAAKLMSSAVVLSVAMVAAVCALAFIQGPGQVGPSVLLEARSYDDPHIVPDHELSAIEPASLVMIATWLSERFDLPTVDELPRVEFVSPSRLVAIRYPSLLRPKVQTPALRQAMVDAQRDTLAVYDETTGTIYLSEGWRGKTPAEMSVLVHEIVHHLQRQARMEFGCPQERERLAYMAQDRWLEQFGLSLESEFGIDPFTRLVRIRCMG
jgi:hypothetical protein